MRKTKVESISNFLQISFQKIGRPFNRRVYQRYKKLYNCLNTIERKDWNNNIKSI